MSIPFDTQTHGGYFRDQKNDTFPTLTTVNNMTQINLYQLNVELGELGGKVEQKYTGKQSLCLNVSVPQFKGSPTVSNVIHLDLNFDEIKKLQSQEQSANKWHYRNSGLDTQDKI